MAFISYKKLWLSEVFNIVSAKDREQDTNLTQPKLKVNNSYKKDEKVTTNFEASDPDDVINKSFLDKKLSRIEGHISLVEKDYNEFKLKNNKQSVEEIIIEKTVKTTIQVLYDRGLFDTCNPGNAHEVGKAFLLFEVNDRRRTDLEKINDIIQ